MELIKMFDERTDKERERDTLIDQMEVGSALKVDKEDVHSTARAVEAKYGKYTASIRNVGDSTYVVRTAQRTPKPRVAKPPVVAG